MNISSKLQLGFLLCAAVTSGAVYATDDLIVEKKATINASCDQVWDFAGGFGTIDNMLKVVVNIEADGDSVGSIRVLTLSDGAVIKERLDTIEANSYSYSFTEHPLPVSKYSATISVADADDGKCDFNWTGKLVAKGVPDKDAMAIFAGIYDSGIAEIMKKFP